MHRIFLGTAVWTICLFIAEFAVGFFVSPQGGWAFNAHMLGGLFLGTFVCVLHIMVMFHFIGSGKELKDAAEILGADKSIYDRVRRFKAVTFPFATFAPIVTGAAVILGGGVHTGSLPGWVHWGLGLGALILNLIAFPCEYRALKANLELIQEVDYRLRQEVSPVLFDEDDEDEDENPKPQIPDPK